MLELKIALPHWFSPAETAVDVMEEFNGLCNYELSLTWLKITDNDGDHVYLAQSNEPMAFYYLGLAVSRILE